VNLPGTIRPSRVNGGGEAVDLDPHTIRLARDMDEQDVQRRLDALGAESRRLRRIAGQLEEEVPDAPVGYDEGLVGIHEFADAMSNANDYPLQTRQKVLNTVRRWVELHGDLPIEKWERRHLDRFDEVLTGLPSSKRHDISKLPIREAVVAGAKEGLPPIVMKTRSDYIDYMKLLSKYAVNRAGLLTVDPFTGYQPRSVKESYSNKKKAKRISYTPAQVGVILDHCATTFDRELIDHWLPLLAAYTGARREELGQLTVNDLRVVGNMHVMDITDLDPLQKLKNANSLRSVPLPEVVIAAGFIDYVQERRAGGAHMLFQERFRFYRPKRDVLLDLRPDGRGKLTERYGGRFKEKVREPLAGR